MGRKKLPRSQFVCVNCGTGFEKPRYEIRRRSIGIFCSVKCQNTMTHWKNLVRIGWTVTPTECWEYNGQRNDAGYGVVAAQYEQLLAHRVAWAEKNGPIPIGMIICHSCDNPPCVNDSHLFCGTHADNVADKVAKGRGGAARGEASFSAKLTDEKVREIRRSPLPDEILAVRFSVHPRTINDARIGKSWSHVI